jgi:hypothetical protein
VFPPNISGKRIKIEVEGGYAPAWRAQLVCKLEISEAQAGSALQKLYEWEGSLPVVSTYFGGITVQGTPIQNNMSEDWVLERFEDLMTDHCLG